MVHEVVWLESAQNDIQDILTYIHADSPRAATQYVKGLRATAEGLREFPQIGRSFNSRYRVTVYRNHLLFYRVVDSESLVEIVRVIDARRDVDAIID
jgi:addiction module RelE/StbE family toxin